MARSTNPRAAKAADAETTASSFDALMADLENDEDELGDESATEQSLDPDGNPPSTETPTGSADTAELEKAFEATVPASTEPAPTEPAPTEPAPTEPAQTETAAAKPRKKKADEDDLSHLPKSTRAEIEAGRKALKKFAASRAAE